MQFGLTAAPLVFLLCFSAFHAEIASQLKPSSKFPYLGCFIDGGPSEAHRSQFDLEVTFQSHLANAEFCAKICQLLGYKYLSTQATDWCHCGNSYGRYGKVADSECNRGCFNPSTETCGSGFRNSVYETKLKTLHMPSSELVQHIGCFADRTERDIPNEFIQSNRMTVLDCFNHCAALEFKYFGLQAGRECRCGHEFGKYGSMDISECKMQCYGDTTTYCGGPLRNTVYEILQPQSSSTTTPSPEDQ